ncbi:MAG: Eco57I restriction-modification methylase domain-containing protein, partial [Candidatus Thorarchaeota archaeon]
MSHDGTQAPKLSRRTGTYYTPPSLAYEIAGQTLIASLNSCIENPLDAHLLPDSTNRSEKKKMLKHLESISVLDPAVGDGVFLKAAADWLMRTRRFLGDERSTQVMKSDIVKRNLFGVDVRQEAVSACSDALVSWTSLENTNLLKSEVLANNIKKGNSLIGWADVPKRCDHIDQNCFDALLFEKLNNSSENILIDLSPFHWPIEFSEISGKGGFDVVLGNPPYGNILSKLEKRIISTTRTSDVSTSRNGTWNVAALFIARSRELLRLGGHLGFLIPNSVLRTRQFLRVRRFLL